MKSVKDVLNAKGTDIWSIAPDALVYDAIELMAQKEIGALPVLENGRLIGIVSERDYTRKVILKGKSSKQTLVREIMTPEVICAEADQDIQKGMAMMTTKGVRHLPVFENDRLVGMISLGDLVKAIIAEQESKIRGFENYFQYRTDLLP
jgi:CBS domain-containing protein